jgi:hypothetical protein
MDGIWSFVELTVMVGDLDGGALCSITFMVGALDGGAMCSITFMVGALAHQDTTCMVGALPINVYGWSFV